MIDYLNAKLKKRRRLIEIIPKAVIDRLSPQVLAAVEKVKKDSTQAPTTTP